MHSDLRQDSAQQPTFARAHALSLTARMITATEAHEKREDEVLVRRDPIQLSPLHERLDGVCRLLCLLARRHVERNEQVVERGRRLVTHTLVTGARGR